MKRLLLPLLTLMFFGLTQISVAQNGIGNMLDGDDPAPAPNDSTPPQRIGVPQTEFDLSENETGSVTGYRFDEYLIAPRHITNFFKVLAGNTDAVVRTADGATLTLQDAIDRGMVAVKAYQLNVRFTNTSPSPLSINLAHPAVFWDRQGGDVNPLALNALESPNADYATRQQNIWRVTNAERFLGNLGYYNGSVWNVDRARQREAIAWFQQANKLAASGTLDEPTMDRIREQISSLQARLNSLGFRDREGRSMRQDPAAQIRAFERYAGRQVDGRWSNELAGILTTNESVASQVRDINPGKRAIADVLGKGNNYPNVLTYLQGSRGMMVLVQTPQGVELWNRRGSTVQFESRGNDAVKVIDRAAAALAGQASNDDRVVVYPHVGNGKSVTLAVGKREIEIDRKSLDGFLNGGAVPTSLAQAIDGLAPTKTATTGKSAANSIVIYRGPFVQSPEGTGTAALAKLGMSQLDGADLAGALDSRYAGRIPLFVSDDLRQGAQPFATTTKAQGSLTPASGRFDRFAYAR